MSTWKIGDSWITTDGLTVGVAGAKLASKQEAFTRKKYCTGCGENREAGCGSNDCNLTEGGNNETH